MVRGCIRSAILKVVEVNNGQEAGWTCSVDKEADKSMQDSFKKTHLAGPSRLQTVRHSQGEGARLMRQKWVCDCELEKMTKTE